MARKLLTREELMQLPDISPEEGDSRSLCSRKMGKKEWYDRWKEALLVLAWGVGMFVLGVLFGKCIF